MADPYATQHRVTDTFMESFNLRNLVEGARVLDHGCGDGYAAAKMLAAGAKEAQAIDIAPKAEILEVVNDPYKAPDGDAPSLCLRNGIAFSRNLVSLPLYDAGYDVIWSHHVIEHVEAPVDFLRELWGLLKPGGTLLLGCPNMQDHNVFSPGHIHNFTIPTMIAQMQLAGFAVQDCSFWYQRGQLRMRVAKGDGRDRMQWPAPCRDMLHKTGRIDSDKLPARWNW